MGHFCFLKQTAQTFEKGFVEYLPDVLVRLQVLFAALFTHSP